MRRVLPIKGKIRFGVYVLKTRIGILANMVKNGLILALSGFRSSIAPIIPAMKIVKKKLRF